MSGTEYHKIYGPYKRHVEGPQRNKIIVGDWTLPEFGFLANNQWIFTEKVDGTNIRVMWDGHRVSFGGRTDNAQIPAKLFTVLSDHFKEELFEQTFGEDSVILYGEGYGPTIQSGGKYRDSIGFVLFDVKVGDWWLARSDVENVASKLGADVVPIMFESSLLETIEKVSTGVTSMYGDFFAEGVVGVPEVQLFTRKFERIAVKIKHKDFYNKEN